jgi:endonuclease-3 related protein
MRTTALLTEIYDKMLKRFGPQHWWPGETPFEVMVGAILTQNTNWGNVEKAIGNLKLRGVLDPHAMLRLAPETLAELIRPAGYFNIKTQRLRNFLSYFVENYGGDVVRMRDRSLSTLREELLAVKGIGPETADSILLYALDKPSFVIDAYTHRVLSRHFLITEDADYNEMQNMMMSSFAEDAVHYNEYHALLVRIGKDFCKPKPQCENCPLNGVNWEKKKL